VPLGGPAQFPLVVLALDCTNAFNTLSKQGLLNFLQEGCENHGGTTDDQDQPVGWDLLWSYINAHYGVKGVLKYYHGGKVHLFSSDAGVHQGDPIAGTLFALAIHPIIIKVAEDYDVVVTAYADNIIMSGKMSEIRKAAVMCRDLMAKMNLKLNPAESEAYTPEWCYATPQQLEAFPSIIAEGEGENQHLIKMEDGSHVQWRKDGIKVLGCALGPDTFCETTIKKTANKIEHDLEYLDAFPHVHQRFKLATSCSNTRITYFYGP
jgi:hypothetical protein